MRTILCTTCIIMILVQDFFFKLFHFQAAICLRSKSPILDFLYEIIDSVLPLYQVAHYDDSLVARMRFPYH